MIPRVTLCWLTRTPKGWRYFKAQIEKWHGMPQAKHGWVMEKGQLVEYPQGRYVLRSHRDGKRVYTPLETCNPRDAVIALDRARKAAIADGDSTSTRRIIRTSVAAYVAHLMKNNKVEMGDIARRALLEFIPFCRGVATVRSITGDMLTAYHASLRAKELSKRTIFNKDLHVRSWLKWSGVDTKFLGNTPKYESTLPTIYSPSQITAIRKAAGADSYMGIVIDMALMLGLREQEIMYAEWGDCDWHHKVYRVQSHKRKDWAFSVKDNEQRDIPIPASLLSRLENRHESRKGTTLIVGNSSDRPEKHLLRKLKQLARSAELNCKKSTCAGCNGKLNECGEWVLHQFRRNYITTLLRSGIDIATVREYAGHKDLASTMRYLRPADAPETQAKVSAIKWGD